MAGESAISIRVQEILWNGMVNAEKTTFVFLRSDQPSDEAFEQVSNVIKTFKAAYEK